MNTLLNPPGIVVSSTFAHLTDAVILERVGECARCIKDNFLEIASLVAEWKRRGKDIAVFGLAGVADFLLRVGEGQIAHAVVQNYWPDVDIMNALAKLPKSDQERLANGGTIPVRTGKDGDQVLQMTIETVCERGLRSQVFQRGRIADEAKQRAYILEERKRASQPLPQTVAGVVIDRELGAVKVTRGMTISKEDLKRILHVLES